MLEKTLESPLDCKEIIQVNPRGNQPWIFIVRINVEAEAPILWPPDAKSWFTGKDPDTGKDWKQEEKGVTEDGMVGWHHWLNGHEFEPTPADGKEQRSLACCSLCGCQESDTTYWTKKQGSSYNVQMLQVFPLLKSSETNISDLRPGSTSVVAVTSVFSSFYQRKGIWYSFVLSAIV